MEQLAADYESIRSTAGYSSATGQPKTGRSSMGGQRIGDLDLYALLSHDAGSVLKELMTVRSDDKKNKRQMIIDIIENGKANIPINSGKTTTTDLYKIHMIGMGLVP